MAHVSTFNCHYILAEHVFDQEGVYYKELEQVEWESSEIREWLNGEFYEDTFSDEEKLLIKENVINNSYASGAYSDWNKKECFPVADTKDKIFLLSLEEILNYYGPVEDYELSGGSIGISSSKAICEYPQYKSSPWTWWSRTPRGVAGSNIAVVESSGLIYSNLPTADRFGVRPALYISNENSNTMIAISDRSKSETEDSDSNSDEEKNEQLVAIEYNDDDIVKVLYPVVYIYGEQYYANRIDSSTVLHHDYDTAKETDESVYGYLYEYAFFGGDWENEAEPEMVVDWGDVFLTVPKRVMEMYYNVLFYDKTELPDPIGEEAEYFKLDEENQTYQLSIGDPYGEQYYTIDSVTTSEDGTELTVEFSIDDMFFEEQIGAGKGIAVLVYNRNPLALELGYKFSIKSFEFDYEGN